MQKKFLVLGLVILVSLTTIAAGCPEKKEVQEDSALTQVGEIDQAVYERDEGKAVVNQGIYANGSP